MIHDARVVPTDRRLQLPAAIRRYIGDSVGRWEGSTLLALSGARDEERTKK